MFYSEMLTLNRIDNTCAKCEKTFGRWSDYHMHVMTVECLPQRQMVLVYSKRNLLGVKQPLSDEHKAAIVERWESKQKQGAII